MKKIIYIITLIPIITIFAYLLIFSNKNNSIRVGYNVESLNSAPLVIAYEKGFFEKRGLNIDLIPLKGGNEVRQVLATGNIDLGTGGAANFLIPIAKGAPIKIIAPLSISPIYLFVHPNNTLKTFNDLKGKNIAASPGGSSYTYFLYALKKEGINYKEINFVDLDKSYKIIALMKNKAVDAVLVSEQEETKYREVGAILHQEWENKGYTSSKFPNAIIAANKNFLSKNKEAEASFIDAIIEGHQFIVSYPKEAAFIISDHIKKGSNGAIAYSPEQIEKIWDEKNLIYALWYNPNLFVEIVKIKRETGELDSALTLDEIFDHRFENKLKDAQVRIYES